MDESTKNVCLVVEGLGATSKQEMLDALEELRNTVTEFCGGTSEIYYLDKDNRYHRIQ